MMITINWISLVTACFSCFSIGLAIGTMRRIR